MNKVILMGRLTRDPEVRYSAGDNSMAIARYTLAVDRRFRRDGDSDSRCRFYRLRGIRQKRRVCRKISPSGYEDRNVTGRIQTGSYTNRDGQKVYTTDVVVEDQEFAESKAAASERRQYDAAVRAVADVMQLRCRHRRSASSGDGFMNIPDGIDEELPFN